MLNKIILSLLLIFPGVLVAQEFDPSKFVPVQVESVETVVTPEVIVSDKFEDESTARIAEMRRIAKDFQDMAKSFKEEVERLKEEFNLKMTGSSSIYNDDYVTRDEVVNLVKEEVARQVQLTIYNGKTSRTETIAMDVRDDVAKVNSVTVPGYAGTFDLAPGEFITHVDGVRVSDVGYNQYGPKARTNNYLLMGQRRTANNGWNIRVVQPQSNCTIVNGRLICN